jgi:hypothetical protein
MTLTQHAHESALSHPGPGRKTNAERKPRICRCHRGAEGLTSLFLNRKRGRQEDEGQENKTQNALGSVSSLSERNHFGVRWSMKIGGRFQDRISDADFSKDVADESGFGFPRPQPALRLVITHNFLFLLEVLSDHWNSNTIHPSEAKPRWSLTFADARTVRLSCSQRTT